MIPVTSGAHLIRISWLISLRLSTGRAELGEGASGGGSSGPRPQAAL